MWKLTKPILRSNTHTFSTLTLKKVISLPTTQISFSSGIINRGFHSTQTLQRQQPAPGSNDESSEPQRPLVTWKVVAVTLGFSAVLAYVFNKIKQEKEEKIRREQNKTIGKAAVGGPFTLIDQDGKPVTDSQFRGKFVVMYFGFTHCPDICPTELTKLGKVLDTLEKKNLLQHIQPLFITVDPMRDSVEKVREYVKDFHPKLLGLTGTPEQIQTVCKKHRVYFSKAYQSQGLEEDDDYLVDHTIIFYLFDPKGEFVAFYGNNLNHEEVSERMIDQISSYFEPKKEKSSWFSWK